jgi:GTP-binding protein
LKIEAAEFIRAALRADDFLRDGRPEVAFVGRSNVGKSSLMNRLLGKKGLARISSTPGRTRAVNYFLVNGRFYFVDLPGYGYAKAGREQRRQWAELIHEYFEQASAGGQGQVVLLIDGKVGATPLDAEAIGYLRGFDIDITVVATKIDRLPRGRRAAQLAAVRQSLELDASVPLIPVSARTGEGIGELWHEITAHLQTRRRSTV